MRDFTLGPKMRSDAFQSAGATNGGSSFSHAEETELAFELLQVKNEAELEQFLDDLLKKAWRGIEPVGPKVIGPLRVLVKTVAKKALPFAATTAPTSLGGPAGGAIAGKLGSLVNQALEAEVAEAAGTTATNQNLEKCRQLFEKYRQFVRLTGKAATAAASAPTGASPIAAAQKSLADSAKEKLTRKKAGAKPAEKIAEPTPVAAPVKTAVAAGHAAGQKYRTQAPGGRSCSICEQPPGLCQCMKIGRSGRWFRSGNSIIVNC